MAKGLSLPQRSRRPTMSAAESSIDDILGGAAANYKEGGYVAPLMATGGIQGKLVVTP